jgi:hypothetical protein
MITSRRRTPRPTLPARYGAALLFVAVPAIGCARTGAAPPEPRPAPAAQELPGRAAAPEDSGVEGRGTEARVSAASRNGRPSTLDPSEEITPEELESIPDPLPASPGADGGASTRSPVRISQGASQEGEKSPQASSLAPLWRVQVFATQDRDLADRIAKEAAARLQVRAYVAREAAQYKVRLGDYESEEAAQPLRELALRAGFPGAFRIRCAQQ